jgi:hypothetical protein
MSFVNAIRKILSDNTEGLTPQQIRDEIKVNYPQYYGTETHIKNVDNRNYTSIDNAVLAQIYASASQATDIVIDRSSKPQIFSIQSEDDISQINQDLVSVENIEQLENGLGTLYILGTNTFTKEGDEIIKIGVTTVTLAATIRQLNSKDAPFNFRVIQELEVPNYIELERYLHALLEPFRTGKSRIFFSSKCLSYANEVIDLHKKIISVIL